MLQASVAAVLGFSLGCFDDGSADVEADGAGAALGSSNDGGSSSVTSGGEEIGPLAGATRAHNAVREAANAEPPLPPLAWSETLASYAREWAEALAQRCEGIAHRDQSRYGENIAMRGSSRITAPFSAEEVVDGWASEAACWEFGTIRGSEACEAQCVAALNSNGCGHYTQLVWRDTRRVGCGYATCERNYDYEIWVCNYDPPGNFVGQAPY